MAKIAVPEDFFIAFILNFLFASESDFETEIYL